jgi:hypothetical protein
MIPYILIGDATALAWKKYGTGKEFSDYEYSEDSVNYLSKYLPK